MFMAKPGVCVLFFCNLCAVHVKPVCGSVVASDGVLGFCDVFVTCVACICWRTGIPLDIARQE